MSSCPFEHTIETSANIGTGEITGRIEIILPVRTVSEANCSEPWTKRYRRHKAQKRAVTYALISLKSKIKLPVSVTFTRCAKMFLDAHDNLPMSMKYIVDQTCAELTGDYRAGRADGDKRITIKYGQEKATKQCVKILFEF